LKLAKLQEYVKTALIQLKIESDERITLEAPQLAEAVRDDRILSRSFILAASADRPTIRLSETKQYALNFPANQDSQRIDPTSWGSFTQWLWKWFSCEIGPESRVGDAESIENLLSRFVDTHEWDTPWTDRSTSYDIPDNYIPSKAWAMLKFEPKRYR